MERSIVRAQILADTFHGSWNELTVTDVKSALEQIRRLDVNQLSRLLTKQSSIREPIAAGASRFEEQIGESPAPSTRDNRRPVKYMMVIDAGAGTTDFAVFQVFQDPANDRIRYALISPTVRMNRAAGNEVDAKLRPLILRSCGIDPASGSPRSKEDFAFIETDLEAQLRDYKQLLFERGEIDISLRPNVRGRLTRDVLLKDAEFQALGRQLEETQRSILGKLFPDEFLDQVRLANQRFGRPMQLYVLLTGGSSPLPIVQRLAEGEIEIKGARFQLVHVRNTPTWIDRLPSAAAELVGQNYPQCAVSIGGSVAELPEEIADFTSPLTPAPPGSRRPGRYQVTGLG
jgi:hypothetical protein